MEGNQVQHPISFWKNKLLWRTKTQLEEIASIKLPDLNTNNINSAVKIIEGTASNMGISVID